MAVPAELLRWWLRVHPGGLQTSLAPLGAALAPTAMREWRLMALLGGWGVTEDPQGHGVPLGTPPDPGGLQGHLSGSTSGL